MNKFIWILIFFFSSCASTEYINSSKKVALSQNLQISLSKLRQVFPKNAIIKQFITYQRADKSEDAQVIIKNTQLLQLTMLSPFGIELLSLKVEDGKIIKISGIPGIKIEFFERAMADILVIYGSLELLQKQIQGDFKLKQTLKSRIISSGGNEVISIDYTDENFWKSKVIYKHKELKYKLTIETNSITYETVY